MSLSSIISSGIDSGTSKSRLAKRVLTISTLICFAVIVVSISIEKGFRETIKNRAENLLSSAQIVVNNPWSDSGELIMADYDSTLFEQISAVQGVERAFAVLDVGAVAQRADNNRGVRLHGVDVKAFGDNLSGIIVEGSALLHQDSLRVIVSTTLASALNIGVGDNLSFFIFDSGIPIRSSFIVGGIYSTSMGEIEEPVVFAPIDLIRGLLDVDSSTIAAYEVVGHYDESQMDDIVLGNSMRVVTLQERVGELFDWFSMLQSNVLLVLIIMVVVALVNIVSSTLIIILENTARISLLGALGMRLSTLQWIFLRRTLVNVCRGALYGILLGYVVVILQNKFSLIELDESAYFVRVLPMDFAPFDILTVFLVSLSLVAIVVWVITRQVSKMEITKGLKYE